MKEQWAYKYRTNTIVVEKSNSLFPVEKLFVNGALQNEGKGKIHSGA